MRLEPLYTLHLSHIIHLSLLPIDELNLNRLSFAVRLTELHDLLKLGTDMLCQFFLLRAIKI
jgi:hypothetical protein